MRPKQEYRKALNYITALAKADCIMSGESDQLVLVDIEKSKIRELIDDYDDKTDTNAEKMFREIGYRCKKERRYFVYAGDQKSSVVFYINEKTYFVDGLVEAGLHLAIHQQMKELGWIK